MIDLIVTSIWLMIPAYIANPMAVVFGGGTPIDCGKNFYDGRRILGDGKTIRGLIAGTACGLVAGLIQIILAPVLAASGLFGSLDIFQSSLNAYTFNTIHVVFLMALGALLGDSAESFIKRRINLKRGAMFPVADQLDFVVGAWILTYILASAWFIIYFDMRIIITVLIITPLLHITTNIIGYLLKLKKEPW
ncbi:MAG: CDP-2,3-bis-(O-geranylgeranyl)-sn-glycerol synthase [Candidatus Methanomarinus sp.]|uniref:CDP-2,3-bis-(O-geranylgeranyl)-sn-glycerol synthase n=1 Tax=Candidatus Methanomarinus sp. TaxID=3386244 RepID=A0AC61SA13_9EURY|nr:MAG: CDP-2,3-bis-(O-geranylgeranyl)-sn-glycerol synthase [ANME-2 cluster archaeon]